MASSLRSKRNRLATKATELLFATPEVIAHRTNQMMGLNPSAGDHAEFRLMGNEKLEAMSEVWNDMASHLVESNQRAALEYMNAWMNAWAGMWMPLAPGAVRAQFPSPFPTAGQMEHAALDMLGKGMAPVHKRAVSNARRLRRTKRR
jgi:hypothetical protein